jgi:hypothetical protein
MSPKSILPTGFGAGSNETDHQERSGKPNKERCHGCRMIGQEHAEYGKHDTEQGNP